MDAVSLQRWADEAFAAKRHADALAALNAEVDPATLDAPTMVMRDACIARAAWALGDWRVALRAILAAHGHDAPRPDWAGHLLQTILLRHAGRAAWVPPALASTLDRFGAASIAVLQGEAPTAVERPAGVTWMALGMLFYDTRLKVIEVAGLDPERRREVAAQYGLSPEFLDIAAGGHQAIATACYARFPDLPFADDPWLNVRIKDIAAAARLGGKPLLCPFTAEGRLSRDTLGIGMFRHMEGDRVAISAYAMSKMDVGGDANWLLPAEGLVLVTMPHAALRRYGAAALARLASDGERLLRGFALPERRVAVAETREQHVGHDLWNFVAGWSRLLALVPATELSRAWVVKPGGQLYPPAPVLFPELGAAGPRLKICLTNGRMLDVATDEGQLLFWLLDDRVTDDLARRVLDWAKSLCPPSFLGELAALKAGGGPMLLVTLRLGNRAWIEQEEGLVAVLRALGEEFPGLVAVLDGLNAFNHEGTSHALMSVEAEQALAQRLVAALEGQVRVVNTIGCPLVESLMYCEAVDAYLAPIGAGMAKVRWVANKPGVAYSNTTMLAPGHLDGWLYDNPRYREAPVQALRIPRESVTDSPLESKWGSMRDNYSFDWRELVRPAGEMLRRLGFGPGRNP